MESIFRNPPPSSISGSQAGQESPSLGSSETKSSLTHVDRSGEAWMVDISVKQDSKRIVVASCKVMLSEKVFNLVAANQTTKGDILNVAKIASITGAKQTSCLIPLCHDIIPTHVVVDLVLNEKEFSVDISGEAATIGKIGVEVEALTAVTVIRLIVYDMCKVASKDIQMTDIHLEKKMGTKSRTWVRKQ